MSHCRFWRCERYIGARLSPLKRNDTTSVSRTIGFMRPDQSSRARATPESWQGNRRWIPLRARSRRANLLGREERQTLRGNQLFRGRVTLTRILLCEFVHGVLHLLCFSLAQMVVHHSIRVGISSKGLL